MPTNIHERRSRKKIYILLSASMLVLACIGIKFLVADKLPLSLTAFREILGGASDIGHLANGSANREFQVADGIRVPTLVGSHPLIPHPLPRLPMPDHPFLMDETASGGVHGDTYNSSTTPYAGPLGIAPIATYVPTRPGNEISMCTPMLMTPGEKLASLCVGLGNPSQLVLFDPKNNFKVAAQVATTSKKMNFLEPGMGWYTGLDALGRAIVANPEQKVQIYSIVGSNDQYKWSLEKEYDLSSALPDGQPISDVHPDWKNNLWFSTMYGYVGYINQMTGKIERMKLPGGEVSGTALALNADATFVLTTMALYRFEIDDDGKIITRWRYEYGQSNSSGDLTAPTLFDEGKLISFGLNDDSHRFARVLVLKTDGAAMASSSRVVCEHPVFKEDRGYLDNTFVGYGKSLVIQNNYGSKFFEPAASEPGLARVDVRPGYSGCNTIWENYAVSSKVPPKLSTADGYVYQYTMKSGDGDKLGAFYLSALDFQTGKLASEIFIGSGKRLDSPMLSINFLPGGVMVAGVRNGLVTLRDRPEATAGAR